MIELAFIPAAFLAGILMFLAPCTLPIVPGYLAFIAGGKDKVLRNALAFVVGFSVVFIVLGTFAGVIGALLGPWRSVVGQAAGALIILFGLTMLGVVRIPLLSSERHARIPKFLTIGRPESSFLMGTLFALGWSPCIGPILGTILLLASSSTTALGGALLLAVFSSGLALPFLLTALLIKQAGEFFTRWEKITAMLSYVGGVVLIGIGLLMLTNNMGLLTTFGYGLFDSWGYSTLLQYL